MALSAEIETSPSLEELGASACTVVDDGEGHCLGAVWTVVSEEAGALTACVTESGEEADSSIQGVGVDSGQVGISFGSAREVAEVKGLSSAPNAARRGSEGGTSAGFGEAITPKAASSVGISLDVDVDEAGLERDEIAALMVLTVSNREEIVWFMVLPSLESEEIALLKLPTTTEREETV